MRVNQNKFRINISEKKKDGAISVGIRVKGFLHGNERSRIILLTHVFYLVI